MAGLRAEDGFTQAEEMLLAQVSARTFLASRFAGNSDT